MIGRRVWLLLRFGVIGGGVALVTQDAVATNYPLICFGMRTVAIGQKPNVGVVLTGSFDAAPQKADAGPLPPFSCAWHDRPLRSTEPRCIAVTNASGVEFRLMEEAPGGVGAFGNGTNPAGGIINAFNGETITFSIGSQDPNNGGCFTPVSAQ